MRVIAQGGHQNKVGELAIMAKLPPQRDQHIGFLAAAHLHHRGHQQVLNLSREQQHVLVGRNSHALLSGEASDGESVDGLRERGVGPVGGGAYLLIGRNLGEDTIAG